jgi:hypothetical protein
MSTQLALPLAPTSGHRYEIAAWLMSWVEPDGRRVFEYHYPACHDTGWPWLWQRADTTPTRHCRTRP